MAGKPRGVCPVDNLTPDRRGNIQSTFRTGSGVGLLLLGISDPFYLLGEGPHNARGQQNGPLLLLRVRVWRELARQGVWLRIPGPGPVGDG